MNITPISAPAILLPLQGLWRWLTAMAAHGSATAASTSSCTREFTGNPMKNNRYRKMEQGLSVRRPLRIIHVHEAGQAPAYAGRMVISGRMADVCAELDRLAAREAALH